MGNSKEYHVQQVIGKRFRQGKVSHVQRHNFVLFGDFILLR